VRPAEIRRATRRAIRGRVACALATPLAGDERPEVLRWLGGQRRLDDLILPLGVTGGRPEGNPTMTDPTIHADVLVSVTLTDSREEPLSDDEVRQLLGSHSYWEEWDVVEVQTIKREA
jgi:hypothetical protein